MSDEGPFIKDVRKIASTLSQEGLAKQSRLCAAAGAGIESSGGNNRDTFIGASRTVLELGHPTSSSILLGLVTDEENLVHDSLVTVLGKSPAELAPGRHAIAAMVFVQAVNVDESIRRDLNKRILSCNRLGGVMVRVSSGRIWLRFSREALTSGLSMDAIGRHIIGQIKAAGDRYEAAEIMFVVGERDHIERFRPVAEKQAQLRNDRYQSALEEKMACETGWDCDQCPETETCKVLKGAVAVKRRMTV